MAADQYAASHDGIGIRISAVSLAPCNTAKTRLAEDVPGEDSPGLHVMSLEMHLQVTPAERRVGADNQRKGEPRGAHIQGLLRQYKPALVIREKLPQMTKVVDPYLY